MLASSDLCFHHLAITIQHGNNKKKGTFQELLEGHVINKWSLFSQTHLYHILIDTQKLRLYLDCCLNNLSRHHTNLIRN